MSGRLSLLRWSLLAVCFVVAFLSTRLVTLPSATFLFDDTSIQPGEERPPPRDDESRLSIVKQKPPMHVKNATFSANDIYWCEGSREGSMPEGKHFHHFPHAMEFMARCWSWFMEKDAYPGRCGIVLDSFASKRLLDKANTDWIVKILKITGCEVRVEEAEIDHNGTDTIYVPDMREQNDLMKHDWVNSSEHAWALRDVLLEHYRFPLELRRNTTTRIGFVDRPDSRRVTNLREIMMNVTQEYDNIAIDMTWFTSSTPMEDQIKWFASHDMIIGAHGASMTNCLFIQPQTVVIEIFPKNYFPVDFFGSLITQVGGIHLPLYSDHHLSNESKRGLIRNLQTGIAATRAANTGIEERHKWRNLDIVAHVDDVMHLVQRGMWSILGTEPQPLHGNVKQKGPRKKKPILYPYQQVRINAYHTEVDRLVNSTMSRIVYNT